MKTLQDILKQRDLSALFQPIMDFSSGAIFGFEGLIRGPANSPSAPAEYSVFLRCPLPIRALNQYLDAPIPPLLKGYLRLGAYICGEPAWDPEFNTADLFILLPMSRMSSRYAKHFLKT